MGCGCIDKLKIRDSGFDVVKYLDFVDDMIGVVGCCMCFFVWLVVVGIDDVKID